MPTCPHCGGERVPSGERARCKSCGKVLGLQPRRLGSSDVQAEPPRPPADRPQPVGSTVGDRSLAFGAGERI